MVLLLPALAFAGGHLHPEKYYQEAWCSEHGGQMAVTMPNGTRADCVTDEYAVEVEFAPKWAEAIGQSLNYAYQSGKKPGIVLVIEDGKDWRFYERLKTVADQQQIQIWVTSTPQLTPQSSPKVAP